VDRTWTIKAITAIRVFALDDLETQPNANIMLTVPAMKEIKNIVTKYLRIGLKSWFLLLSTIAVIIPDIPASTQEIVNIAVWWSTGYCKVNFLIHPK
jgi:hypothetical protein